MNSQVETAERQESLKYAIGYFAICIAGIATGWIVGALAVTSFFAFVYLVINRGPRTFVMALLMLIPVVGALVALDRLLRKAWPQLLGGIFFYIFPLTIIATTGVTRLMLSLSGGALMFTFLTFIPSVAYNKKRSIIFMWAIPSTMFFVIAAIVVPFIGHAANVDAGDHHHDFDFGHSDHGNYHNFGAHHQSISHTPLHQGDHGFDHGVHADHPVQATTIHQPDKIHLDSYPNQSGHSGIETSHFTTHTDHVSGHMTVSNGNGHLDFRFDPLTHTYHGNNTHAEGMSVHHDVSANTMSLHGHGETHTFHFDKATGDWVKLGPNGMTRIHTDPNTGNISVTGPGMSSALRIDPITGDGTGSITGI